MIKRNNIGLAFLERSPLSFEREGTDKREERKGGGGEGGEEKRRGKEKKGLER